MRSVTFVLQANLVTYLYNASNVDINCDLQVINTPEKPMPGSFRCDCPITSALDILGDKWSLVIVKQMLLEGRKTFKDFIAADEAIATNILSNRLKTLEELELISKHKHPENKKVNIYRLTESGLDLTPIIVELALFSDGHLRGMNDIVFDEPGIHMMKTDREGFIEMLKNGYRSTGDE